MTRFQRSQSRYATLTLELREVLTLKSSDAVSRPGGSPAPPIHKWLANDFAVLNV